MLAKPTKAITEVLDRFEGKEFTCEYKYDGERAQVCLHVCRLLAHLPRDPGTLVGQWGDRGLLPQFRKYVGEISRSGRANTTSMSDGWIVPGMRLSLQCIKEGVKSFVIDAEAVAYDLETKRLLPFQDLSRRKRKDVRTEDITVRVHLFAFDLLYLNGEVSMHPASWRLVLTSSSEPPHARAEGATRVAAPILPAR